MVDMSFKSALQLLNFRFQMTIVLKDGKLFSKAYTCGLGVCHFRGDYAVFELIRALLI